MISMAAMVGWGAWTTPAEACQPDPCEWTDEWLEFELLHDRLATDGVLVFAASRASSATTDPSDTLPYVSVIVGGPGAGPVSGALEYDAAFGVVLWRPDAPLTPETEYSVSMRVDNSGLREQYPTGFLEGCAPDFEDSAVATTGAGPLGELSLPGASTSLSVQGTPILGDLATLVCCDAAMPESQYSCFQEVYWSTGHCEGTTEVRRLVVDYAFDWSAFEPEQLGNVAVRLVSDDGQIRSGRPGTLSLSMSPDVPICVTVEAVDLTSGATLVSRQECFGEDAGPLGVVAVNPSDALDAACEGEPYVCALDPSMTAWDPEACMPWEDEGGTDDGGTGDGGSGDGGSADGGTADGGTADGGTADGGDDSGGADDGGTAGQDGLSNRGCSCATTGNTAPLSLMLPALMLGIARRRRT
jgi:MYXO-CTERM domain-containing protein